MHALLCQRRPKNVSADVAFQYFLGAEVGGTTLQGFKDKEVPVFLCVSDRALDVGMKTQVQKMNGLHFLFSIITV